MEEIRLRRPMFLLSMIVALTATPFRLAEAASDLARAIAESGGGAGMDEIDGGVGDDSGATIKADSSRASVTTAIADILPGLTLLSPSTPGHGFKSLAAPPGRYPASALRRRSVLQCFLC